MAWQFNHTESVFFQIARHLRGEILRGVYLPNQQIPSVRQLATVAAVNPNTMQKALTLLEEEGLLYTKGTLGRFVTADADVLQKAREQMKQERIGHWLAEAKSLGISYEDVLHFMREEEKNR